MGIPKVYVKWGAIFAVAVAMGKHIWGENLKGRFYPNLYVMLVGPPGTGKTQTEMLISPFLRDLGLRVSAQHVSKAALIDELSDSKGRISPDTQREYKHLVIVSSEFVETFPGYDVGTLGMLSRWWDCPDEVRERKRHLGDLISIKNVVANMLTGVQPSVLAYEFPVSAWQGGFLSRALMVYVPKRIEMYLWERPGEKYTPTYGEVLSPEIYTMLMSDLEAISMMSGLFGQSNDFLDAYFNWCDKGQQPRPKHPRLAYYNDRREHQIIKLSLISAASRNSNVLQAHDFERALSWLEEIETNIDEIFVEMATTDELVLMKDLRSFILRVGRGKEIAVSRIWTYLAGKVPSQRIATFIEAASKAGFIQLSFHSSGMEVARPGEIVE